MPRTKTKPSKNSNKNNGPGIPRATFRRIVEEIAASRKGGLRFQKEAISALHEESEKFVEEHFNKAASLLRVCKTATLQPKIFRTARSLTVDPVY